VSAKDIPNTDKQVTYIPIREVVAKPGIFQPHNGKCQAEIAISGLGGFKILFIRQMDAMTSQETKDITGIAWLTDSVLVYTVSPIYGNPGVYMFDCTTKETKRIIAPKNINAIYPNGADYFELYRLSADKVHFYYISDVDSIDFKGFRSQTFLFQSNLDGSEFKKAVDPLNDTSFKNESDVDGLKQDIKKGE
jgi:hypothetical protein